jgi:hypothetical protein
MTSNQDEGMRWLARSVGWERSLERLRHEALVEAASAGAPELPAPAEEPVVSLEPVSASDRGEPAVRAHGGRRSAVHRSHAHGAPVAW